MTCSYSTDAIALSVPENPTKGWKVESSFEPPKIPLTQIHEYQPGKIIPRIKLNMKWLGRTQPREESVKIGVKGGSIDSFRLLCKTPSQLPPPPPPTSSKNVFFRVTNQLSPYFKGSPSNQEVSLISFKRLKERNTTWAYLYSMMKVVKSQQLLRPSIDLTRFE